MQFDETTHAGVHDSFLMQDIYTTMSSIDKSTLEGLRKHLWGGNVWNTICVDGKSYLTVDLALFNDFPQNTSRKNVLLIRDEYRLAYEAILAGTLNMAEWGGSAFLITGQSGNGALGRPPPEASTNPTQ